MNDLDVKDVKDIAGALASWMDSQGIPFSKGSAAMTLLLRRALAEMPVARRALCIIAAVNYLTAPYNDDPDPEHP